MTAVIPPVTKLSSRIIRVLGCNPGQMTLQGTNTYIVGTGPKRILIDTGDEGVDKYIHHLKSVMSEHKITFSHIVLTHWHHDHIGGVAEILRFDNNKDCQVWKYPRSDIAEDQDTYKIPWNRLKDKEKLCVDGASLQVHHAPGHTSDHIVLTLSEERAVFSGDCILGEGTAVFEDLHDYMRSLHKIKNDLKPQVIYPGHGNIVHDPVPKISYYIAHREQREAQILEAFRQNPDRRLDAMDIVQIVYKDTPENLWPAASYNVGHHIDKLVKENKLIMDRDENVRHENGNCCGGAGTGSSGSRDDDDDGTRVGSEHKYRYRKESML